MKIALPLQEYKEASLNPLLPLPSFTDLFPHYLSKSKLFLFDSDLFGQKLFFFPSGIDSKELNKNSVQVFNTLAILSVLSHAVHICSMHSGKSSLS